MYPPHFGLPISMLIKGDELGQISKAYRILNIIEQLTKKMPTA